VYSVNFHFLCHAGVADKGGQWRLCLCVCVCVCVCLCEFSLSKRKTAWTVNTELGTHILYASRSACFGPEDKRSKVKVTRGCYWLLWPLCYYCCRRVGVGLHVVWLL